MKRTIGIGLVLAILGTLAVVSVAAAQAPYPNYFGPYGGYSMSYYNNPSLYGGYYGGTRGSFYSGPYYCYYEPLRGVGRDVYYYRGGNYSYRDYTYLGCPAGGGRYK